MFLQGADILQRAEEGKREKKGVIANKEKGRQGAAGWRQKRIEEDGFEVKEKNANQRLQRARRGTRGRIPVGTVRDPKSRAKLTTGGGGCAE